MIARKTSLAEVLGALSHALDLTGGQRPGHSLRATWIAMQVGEAMGFDEQTLHTAYFTTLLKDLGCSSNAAQVAELYKADDRSVKREFKTVKAGLGPSLGFLISKAASGQPVVQRAGAIANILATGRVVGNSLIETRCRAGARLARQLRLGEDVADAIFSLYERWDGSGHPRGIAGESLPLASRLALLAQTVDVFCDKAGPQAAKDEVARQSGIWLDPQLCTAFSKVSAHPAFWDELQCRDIDRIVAGLDGHGDETPLDEDYLDEIFAVFGHVIDAKSPFTAGHSQRVGAYADAIAQRLGMPEDRRRVLRRAAMLHDVGKLSVSCRILEKPGKLDEEEWRIVKNHAQVTAEILSRVKPLADMAMIAGSHHERLDGTGYPLGLDATMLAPETRIITVCDYFDALTADRPYRAAMPVEKAFGVMEEELGRAIDPECFAILKDLVCAGAVQLDR